MSLIDDNWKKLFDKYNIAQKVEKDGLFKITADQIREFKEPRLMTKFDTKESLPKIFGKNLGILPVTRGSYVIGNFDLHEEFPEDSGADGIINVHVPTYFETIDISNITSEACAINVMNITSIINDFLGEDDMFQTVSGRMGTGSFDFFISSKSKKSTQNIVVQNSQIEIDAGFENENVFALIEGKNVIHNDFLIRQLYYPYRVWKNKISKPIRNIFMVYSNNIYRLLEYEFEKLDLYTSVKLVQEKKYSLVDTNITHEDIKCVADSLKIKPEDKNITFVQADSFDKVISLLENLKEGEMTAMEISDLFGFKMRQSDYYFNAARYLGLVEKIKINGVMKVTLTNKAEKILKLDYKKRQLEYVKIILEHRIFNEIFNLSFINGEIPDKKYIVNRMLELDLCSIKLAERRASSVSGWIRWIFRLVK